MKIDRLTCMGLCGFLTVTSIRANEPAKKNFKQKRLPNIVLILADDLGYGDLNCYGATRYATPYLDRLATSGVRFTNFYVSQAVCSASRAALLTRCYSNRIGIGGALFPYSVIGLNPKEETIAEVLKKSGYTSGIFGKWHLGYQREFLPLQQGFEEYLGLPYSNDMWKYNIDRSVAKPELNKNKAIYPPLPLIDGNDAVKEIVTMDDQAQLTTMYTNRAVSFIEKTLIPKSLRNFQKLPMKQDMILATGY